MLYHSLIKVEEEQISQKIVKELLKYNIKQTFYSLFMSVSKGTGANIKVAEKIRIEQKVKGRIQIRLCKEMRNKTKRRSIKGDKWERKVIKDIKDTIKIRLHMWDLKMNYRKENK